MGSCLSASYLGRPGIIFNNGSDRGHINQQVPSIDIPRYVYIGLGPSKVCTSVINLATSFIIEPGPARRFSKHSIGLSLFATSNRALLIHLLSVFNSWFAVYDSRRRIYLQNFITFIRIHRLRKSLEIQPCRWHELMARGRIGKGNTILALAK